MKIVFVLSEIGLSGGVKVVFEYANRLQERGHDVSVIYPLFPMRGKAKWFDVKKLVNRVLRVIVNLKHGNHVDWFNLKANLIRVPVISEKNIPDADIIVATWWETAYYIKGYSRNKGKKFYLIQHYEIWGGPKEKVDKTYRLGLHNIVISNWLKNILESLGTKVEAVILNGVNSDEFYPEYVERDDSKIRILMPYRSQEWKGIKDGLKALEIVKGDHENVRLVMFGPKPRKGELFKGVEFHLQPTQNELRRIYNSCDIFVFPSCCEGFGLPPMEAMACKCAVVTTNVGAVPEYTIPRKTALVSPPDDAKDLAKNIIRLIENDKERRKIAENGYNHIKQFTWDKATDQLERVFKRCI